MRNEHTHTHTKSLSSTQSYCTQQSSYVHSLKSARVSQWIIKPYESLLSRDCMCLKTSEAVNTNKQHSHVLQTSKLCLETTLGE